MNFLHFKNRSIYSQLLLEEQLLRGNDENWCIVNEGSPRAIVMGISGKPQELLNIEKLERDPIEVIRRFSGGGTVIVDENTLFVTFICQKNLHAFPCYPEPIYQWSKEIYQSVFNLDRFSLRENDYLLSNKKCGGNAQYLKKDRWLHHTSFLWDFENQSMEYLLHPKRTPQYREGRGHLDFLCRIKEHLPCKKTWIETLKKVLDHRYGIRERSIEDNFSAPNRELRQSTTLLQHREYSQGPL